MENKNIVYLRISTVEQDLEKKLTYLTLQMKETSAK